MSHQTIDESGFVAGTLVHTDKGLVPIEQIKVGDWVLSKHDNGQGEQAYKRVVNTFKSDMKLSIFRIGFWLKDDPSFPSLFCTDNHQFWLDGLGWTKLHDFPKYEEVSGNVLRGFLGDRIIVNSNPWPPLRKTEVEDIAICSHDFQWDECAGYSLMVDFRQGRPILVGGTDGSWSELSKVKNVSHSEEIKYLPSLDSDDPEAHFYLNAMGDDWTRAEEELGNVYKTHVCNLEVEDYHTYYVGKAGIWVRSC
ncbi:hypothetical protein EV700_0057 [Fluviicoccus keumensis]|uniref:Intein n=1 Tax=Fluviicoccus keumensis TaxID=1435465 RepID=A0A4V2G6D2_9GAMM|nr:hypothetical protein [Fluviicoccus keumensis]RZU48266.1 hypothetical protein EV700_0057 [Fluviicoccus keumensis]